MSANTWGLLPKSLTDSQIITAYIAAQLAIHNADDSAHGQSDEAVYNHRIAEILDHLEGSVLIGKLTNNELFIHTNFESIDAWGRNGQVNLSGFSTLVLHVETGITTQSDISTEIAWGDGYLDYSKNLLFQTVLGLNNATNIKVYMLTGFFVSSTNLDGFGFEIVNGVLKGIWNAAAGIVRTDAITCDTTKVHVYRCQYVAAETKIYFYVDGEVVATLTDANMGDAFQSGEPTFVIQTNGTADSSLTIKELVLSRSAI